jgi:hypothetical protein
MSNTDKPEDDMCFGCLKTECKDKDIFASNKAKIKNAMNRAEILIGLGIPLLAFVLGFFLIYVLFPNSGDPARAIGGVVLMFCAGLGYYKYRSRKKKIEI